MLLNHYACKRAYLTNEELLVFLKDNAKFIGEAKFTDHVFDSVNTDKNLLWVRYINKNVWPSMKQGKFYPFYKSKIRWLSHFQIFQMPVGIPLKECSSLKEAKKHLPGKLNLLFSFSRTTWEYKSGDLSVYVEEVDHIPPTIEVVCRTEKRSLKENRGIVDNFFKKHKLTATIPHQVATLVGKEIKKLKKDKLYK